METTGKVLVGAIMLLVTILMTAYTFATLWGLFIVPLGLQAISVAHAYGISLIVGLFKINPYKRNKEPPTWEDFVAAVFVVIFICLMALGLGHFAAMFM